MTDKPLPDLHVLVKFGKGVPYFVQAEALMAFEKYLRDISEKQTGERLWIEVFKEIKGDDSKLRVLMTLEQRKSL